MTTLPFNEIRRSDRPEDHHLLDALDSFLRSQIHIQHLPGLNIALARGGEIIWEAAYGYADAKRKIEQTPETVFHSGSMGKTYTGVAVMQLVERGILSLKDTASRHLGFEVRNPLSDTEITIWNLLTHTSGFGGDAAGSVFEKPDELEIVVRRALGRDHQDMMGGIPTWTHKPGEIRLYSNLGMAILGLIVQKANPDGLSYSDWIQQKIMNPVGAKYAQYPPAQHKDYVRPEVWERMSTGYFHLGNTHLPTATVYFDEYPAGGFLATPADHLRFILAMLYKGSYNDAQVLKPETVEQMLTQQVEGMIVHGAEAPRERQGLIWWLRDVDDMNKRRKGWAFHHGGGHMYGWRTQAVAWPDLDAACVYGINQWSPVVTNQQMASIEGFIHNWLMAEFKPPVAAATDAAHAYKTSYVQGLLYATSYRDIGCPGRISQSEIDRLMREETQLPWVDYPKLPFDPDAFRSGISDIYEVAPTRDAYVAFFESGKSRVPLEAAMAIYQELTGGLPGMASMLGVLLGIDPMAPYLTEGKTDTGT